MSGAKEIPSLDPKDFKLTDYDNVRITMPEKPSMTEDDVDAQLFEYVLSSGKQINSIADLDENWVKANFDGFETIDDVRQAIKDQYDKELEFEYSDMKFRACCDALIDRLEGDIPDDVLEANVDAVREANQEQLSQMHISLDQYLREEHLTPDQYESKLRAETLHQLKLNMALDLLIEVLGMQVGNHELTEYLQAPNPEKFLEEIRENDLVDEARQAAARVKAMRRVVDTAYVNGKIEPLKHPIPGANAASGASVAPGAMSAPPTDTESHPMTDDEDIEFPDMASIPLPQIRDDKPTTRYTILDN